MRYDEQYYIAFEPHGDDRLFAAADDTTSERGYHYIKPALGAPPFIFRNAYLDKDKKRKVTWPITDVLVVGGDLLVKEYIKNQICRFDTSGLYMQPSIYINDEGERLDDYWFLTFYKTLDCWDRDRSVVDIFEDDEDDDLDGIEPTIEVDKFVLDSEVLDEIPENERLLFKMGGNVSKSYVVVHQKVVDFFEKNNISGVRFFKLSEFEEGDQFRP